MLRTPLLFAVGLLLLGCEGLSNFTDAFNTNTESKLPGKRLIILTEDHRLSVDPVLSLTPFTPPAAEGVNAWPVLRQNSEHFLENLAWNGIWEKRWSQKLVGALSAQKPLQAPVVVAGGIVFSMDHDYNVQSTSLQEGTSNWLFRNETDIGFTNAYGGGLALAAGKVIMTTGYGDIVAIDALVGKESWRISLGLPIRSSPTVAGNTIVVQTLDNQAFAFLIEDGSEVWFHAGINEITSVVNQTSAASDGERVFLAYNSGEIAAIDPHLGEPLWLDELNNLQRSSELAQINTIGASPILINDALLVPGYGELMVLFNASNGQRLWEQPIGTLKSPWVSGALIFVLGNDDSLYALDLFSGKLRWRIKPDEALFGWQKAQKAAQNPVNTDEDTGIAADDFKRQFWAAPVMINNELVLLSEEGTLLRLSPDNGRISSVQQLEHGSRLPPQVVSGTVLITDSSGSVHTYQ